MSNNRNALITHLQNQWNTRDDGMMTDQTTLAASEYIRAFSDELHARSKAIAARRSTSTVTDADVREAFHEMTSPMAARHRRKSRMLVVDICMVGGTFLMSLWQQHWLVVFSGLFILCIGLWLQWGDPDS